MPSSSFAAGVTRYEEINKEEVFDKNLAFAENDENVEHVDVIDAELQFNKLEELENTETIDKSDLYHLARKLPQFGDQKLGVCFHNLTVYGTGSDVVYRRSSLDAVVRTLSGYELFKYFKPLFKKSNAKRNCIISDFSGVIYPGEILLVLGKPGAGCTTFLRAIGNEHAAFHSVEGEISYNNFSSDELKSKYPGKVIYNPTEDFHLPTLTVSQTLEFASSAKFSKRHKDYVSVSADTLIRMFGLTGTVKTKVGNEYLRGVSGGEKKRLSIAEALLTRASVSCWDNSTRGLDSSTAIDYVKSLRILCDCQKQTTLLTLYQASDEIYKLVDKVLLIYEGRMIYFGQAATAVSYFENLGFVRREGQTIADFLTSSTDQHERNYKGDAEISADYLADTFKGSQLYKTLEHDLQKFETASMPPKDLLIEQSRYASSGYIISFFRQVKICCARQWWLTINDRENLFWQLVVTIVSGLLTGSTFYNLKDTTSYIYPRGGALFLGILYVGWVRLSEVASAVSNREVLARHRFYAFYRPSAFGLARWIVDLPFILGQSFVITILIYFLCNLKQTASAFFTFLLFNFTYSVTLVTVYRALCALCKDYSSAIRLVILVLDVSLYLSGYMVPLNQFYQQIPWFGWLQYFNFTLYAFEAIMTNEFHDKTFTCANPDLVPSGPGYDPRYQTCSITGSSPSSTDVSGDLYLSQRYGFEYSHIWRNYGILIAWLIFYLLLEIIALEKLNFITQDTSVLEQVRKRFTGKKKSGVLNSASKEKESSVLTPQREYCFTWKDISLKLHADGANEGRRLLDNISGWAKSGEMLALIGSSGAGKTTLLNTLAFRNRNLGTVTGSIMLNGVEVTPHHSRFFAYCEQMDIHDTLATVEEAFQFSAMLRQPHSVSKEMKIHDVEELIDLLELQQYRNCLINSLPVDIRKLVTIGVELCAKPEAVLFLDEPTSGLDSQSAYNIVRFMRKLADSGLAIVCTIHQPSASLFNLFDRVISLTKGQVFYFGDLATIPDYAQSFGIENTKDKNLCEVLISLSHNSPSLEGGTATTNEVVEHWKSSLKRKEAEAELNNILSAEKYTQSNMISKSSSSFSTPFWTQLYHTTVRQFKHQYRDYAYNYTKIFTAVTEALLSGLSFFRLNNSARSFEKYLFSIYFAIVLPASYANMIVVKYMQMRRLFESREGVSKIYSWYVLVTSQLLVELPYMVIPTTAYWVIWYWVVGLPAKAIYSGYSYLMLLIYMFWTATLGVFLGAMGPSFTLIVNMVAFTLIMGDLFVGVTQRLDLLNVFWRYWAPYVTPLYFYVSGLSAGILADLEVVCRSDELIRFVLPPGQTSCEQYAAPFLENAIGALYPSSDQSSCSYCPYKDGNSYIESIGFHRSTKWRDFGILIGYALFNCILAYIFTGLRFHNRFSALSKKIRGIFSRS